MLSGLISVELPGAARSVAAARRLVRSTLTEWDLDELTELAALLTSELATNAVLHARTGLFLQIERRSGSLRITVADDSPMPPHRRTNGLHAATGRGLALVDTLAQAWGTDAPFQGHAKGVWFELSEDAAGHAASEGALYGEDWLGFVDGH